MISKYKRIKLKGQSIAKLNNDIHKRDGHKCIICGRFVASGEKWHHEPCGCCMEDRIEARNREGEECLKKNLLFNKNYWQALHALGMLFYDTQQYEYAIEYYQAALKINSSAIYSYVGLGKIYRHNNNLDKALHFFQKAVNHDPDNPVLHSLVMEIYLRSGNLYDGFIEHECRKRIPEANDFFKPFMALPQWQGAVFSGKKLLVHCEQGMDDTLQFIRYLPQVKMRSGFVAVLCQAPLLRLLKNFRELIIFLTNLI